MAKKKPETGLTEQLITLVDAEHKATSKAAKKQAKREASRLKKELAKGVKRLNGAIKQASERLLIENNIAGATIIEVTDLTFSLEFDRFDGPFEPVMEGVLEGIPVAAWVNGGWALVPEHYHLATPLGEVAVDDEVWVFTTPNAILTGLLAVEENAATVLTELFVDPLIEWLEGLGQPEPKPASEAIGLRRMEQ